MNQSKPLCWTAALLCSLALVANAHPQPREAASTAAPSDIRQALHSSILNEERRFLIRLPNRYVSDASVRYPVLFKLESADGLKRYDNLIVVVLPNARDQRNRDMTPASLHQEYDPEGKMGTGEMGRGDRFLDFLEQELIPHIDAKFRTTTPRVLAGHSRGALLVLQSLLSKPDLFQARFIFSAPLMRDEQRLIVDTRKFLTENPGHRSFVYFNWGEEENPGMNASCLAMKELLTERAPKGLRWVIEHARGANHQQTPLLALPAALNQLFGAERSAANQAAPDR